MIQLLDLFRSIHPLSGEAIVAVCHLVKEKQLHKGRHWLQEQAVCDKIAFVKKGILQSYREIGCKEITVSVARENEVMIDARSFFESSPAHSAIRAFVDTEIYYIHSSDCETLCRKYPDFAWILLTILKRLFMKAQEQQCIQMEPMENKMNLLKAMNPWMFTDQRVNDAFTASVLGISPQHFSYIKNKPRK